MHTQLEDGWKSCEHQVCFRRYGFLQVMDLLVTIVTWKYTHLSLILSVSGRSELEDFKLSMATPTSSHMVGRCFVATESGTYFDGTGYLEAGELPYI